MLQRPGQATGCRQGASAPATAPRTSPLCGTSASARWGLAPVRGLAAQSGQVRVGRVPATATATLHGDGDGNGDGDGDGDGNGNVNGRMPHKH